MTKLLLFPFYLTLKMIELPIKFIWWLLKMSIKLTLVPIGGTYTMNAKQAAGLINEIRPDVAIPVHYGSVVGGKRGSFKASENVWS